MPNAVLIPEYWVPRNCARPVALRSFEVCAVLLLRPPGSLHSCAPLAVLVWDVSCLDGFLCEFWCSAEACVVIVDACFSCILVHGCLGDGPGLRPMLLSFGSSSLCATCYFQDMVWARSVLEFLQSGASLATWQGGGSGPHVCGGQNGIRFRSSISHPPIASSCHRNMSQSSLPTVSVPVGPARQLAYEVALVRLLDTCASLEQVTSKADAVAWLAAHLETIVRVRGFDSSSMWTPCFAEYFHLSCWDDQGRSFFGVQDGAFLCCPGPVFGPLRHLGLA